MIENGENIVLTLHNSELSMKLHFNFSIHYFDDLLKKNLSKIDEKIKTLLKATDI
jgi:hypothetical protein